MNSTPVLRKRKGLPPAAAPLPVTAVRLAPELLANVDRWAIKTEVNRSEAIRRLIELGLKAKRK